MSIKVDLNADSLQVFGNVLAGIVAKEKIGVNEIMQKGIRVEPFRNGNARVYFTVRIDVGPKEFASLTSALKG
jgi:hypothetical protein